MIVQIDLRLVLIGCQIGKKVCVTLQVRKLKFLSYQQIFGSVGRRKKTYVRKYTWHILLRGALIICVLREVDWYHI